MSASGDPRDRVTPTAFAVAPGLLGVELASPPRRAAAFGLDLLLAGVVSAVGGGAAVGLAAAVLFFLVAMRGGSRHPVLRLTRGTFVLIGAVILFGVGTALVDGCDDPSDLGTNVGNTAALGGLDAQGPGTAVIDRVERDLLEAGVDVDLGASASGAADSLTEAERAEAAALLRAYADALARADSAAADTLRAEAARLVAGPDLDARDARIDALREAVDDLDDRNEDLQEALDAPSFVRSARSFAADFGLTLGWIGVYFTLVTSFWGGYTPGKRALGVRVVRLDGRPVTLWTAFERFGGYAAGLVTGLIGFAQILWDPNRQGVQDKIAGTAVVRMADARTPRRVERGARAGA